MYCNQKIKNLDTAHRNVCTQFLQYLYVVIPVCTAIALQKYVLSKKYRYLKVNVTEIKCLNMRP